MATFIHDGNSIDYTPGADVAAGAVVVQGELVGVARTPIAANALGSLAAVGVFDFPKAGSAGVTFAAGANVYWDAANSKAVATSGDPAGTNKLAGKAVAAAVDAATTVRVRLSQ
jgi:predicted RecA/RadA family phage recombinase